MCVNELIELSKSIFEINTIDSSAERRFDQMKANDFPSVSNILRLYQKSIVTFA